MLALRWARWWRVVDLMRSALSIWFVRIYETVCQILLEFHTQQALPATALGFAFYMLLSSAQRSPSVKSTASSQRRALTPGRPARDLDGDDGATDVSNGTICPFFFVPSLLFVLACLRRFIHCLT